MLILALLLIAAGILAAASLIVQKQPNAREAIAKLVPFQGIIGIILLLWGVYMLLAWVIPYLGFIMRWSPMSGLALLLSTLAALGLGFLLGYGLIQQYALSKNADAARSGEAMRSKIAGYQVPLGIIGIVLGLWMLVVSLSAGAGLTVF
jgi:uncharacterized membrane protein